MQRGKTSYHFTSIINIIVGIITYTLRGHVFLRPTTFYFFFFLSPSFPPFLPSFLPPSLPSFLSSSFFLLLSLSLPHPSFFLSPLSLSWWVKSCEDHNKNASPPLQLRYSAYLIGENRAHPFNVLNFGNNQSCAHMPLRHRLPKEAQGNCRSVPP